MVLIEDNWRSAIAFVASYFVWTLAKYVSTKYLIGFFVVSAFSLPRLYLQHQEVIDSHVTQQTKNARALLEQYGGVAGQKAQEYAAQAKDFIVKKTSGAPVEKKVD